MGEEQEETKGYLLVGFGGVRVVGKGVASVSRSFDSGVARVK